MKALKLYRKFTPGIKSLQILGLIMSLNVEATETASGLSLEVAQHQTCTSLSGEVTSASRDFNASCSAAGLGSESQCQSTLNECRESDASDNDQCLNYAASADEVEKNRDRLKDAEAREDKAVEKLSKLQEDRKDLENEALELQARKDEAEAKLQDALAQIKSEEAAAQANANTKMQEIELEIEKTNNQIQQGYNKLRELSLKNEMKCREEAKEIQNKYVAMYRAQRARGKRVRVSQSRLFSMQGLSIKEIGSIKADRHLRACTSIYITGRRGTRITGFGSQYKFQADVIKQQESGLKKLVRRLEEQKSVVKVNLQNTINSLGEQKRRVVASYQKQVLRLSAEEQLMKNRLRNNVMEQVHYQNKRAQHIRETASAQEDLTKSYASMRSSGGDKREAFMDAMKNLSALESSVRGYQSEVDNCGQRAEVDRLASVLGLQQDALIAASGDGDSSTQNLDEVAIELTPGSTTVAQQTTGAVSTSRRPAARPTGQTVSE